MLNELVVMFDLEFLSKDEVDGQILDIGICWGTHPDNLRRISYKPAWQMAGAIQPSTLKWWLEQNPTQLAGYMENSTPMAWVTQDLVKLLHTINGRAGQLGVKQVVIMSKGITHDLPKLEYQISEHCNLVWSGGFGIFEQIFGYNCRRDLRSFRMGRSKELLDEARERAITEANALMPEGVLHDAEYDAVMQWHDYYFIATHSSASNV